MGGQDEYYVLLRAVVALNTEVGVEKEVRRVAVAVVEMRSSSLDSSWDKPALAWLFRWGMNRPVCKCWCARTRH